jgi:uncharacterized membrane protein
MKKFLVFSAIALGVAACGSTPQDRALSGAAIGGASGAVIGGATAGTTGAIVGGAGGAAAGAIVGGATAPRQHHYYRY